MQINIKGTSMEITPSINDYIKNRFVGLEKFTKQWDEKGELELKIEIARTTKHHLKGDVYYAEANLSIPGKALRSEATLEDLYSAIDEAYDEMKKQVERNRDIRLTKIRRGARFIKRLFKGDKE